MILERICMAPVVEVDTLPETARCVQACVRVSCYGLCVNVETYVQKRTG